jgi:hypothetical protein
MPFTLPDFNLSVDFYASAFPPPAHAPIFRSVCSYVQPRRLMIEVSSGAPPGSSSPIHYLLLPTGLSIKTSRQGLDYYWARIVGMLGCHLWCIDQVLIGGGHANAHLQLAVSRAGSWPDLIPLPTPNP